MRVLAWAVMGVLIGCAASAAEPEAAAPAAKPDATAPAADAKSEPLAAQQPGAAPPPGFQTKVEGWEGKEERKERAFKPPTGYKAKIQGWDIVYCRKTPVLGSRFPKEVCMSEAELKDHMAANETMRQNKDQTSRICSSATGCGM